MRATSAIHNFAAEVFAHLRAIDAEAVARQDGLPTGVRWYCGHVNPRMSLDETACVEDLWSDRLAALLREHGRDAVNQCHYPRTARRCDLVVNDSQKGRFWIEVKGEWREWIVRPGHVKRNTSYRKYLISTANDVDKLLLLRRPDADWIGLLVLGFDRPQEPILDADLKVIRSRMDAAWQESYDEWEDQQWVGFRVRTWFWWRPVDQGAASGRPSGPASTDARHVMGQGGGVNTGKRELILADVERAFEQAYPTKTDYNQQPFTTMLRLLGIVDAHEAAEVQREIRSALSSTNDADWLYGARGERNRSPFPERRKRACEAILRVLTRRDSGTA
jgi:hypothetical protein